MKKVIVLLLLFSIIATPVYALILVDKVIYKELSYQIVGLLFEVHNELGYGYKEKYYEEAIARLFIKNKVK